MSLAFLLRGVHHASHNLFLKGASPWKQNFFYYPWFFPSQPMFFFWRLPLNLRQSCFLSQCSTAIAVCKTVLLLSFTAGGFSGMFFLLLLSYFWHIKAASLRRPPFSISHCWPGICAVLLRWNDKIRPLCCESACHASCLRSECRIFQSAPLLWWSSAFSCFLLHAHRRKADLAFLSSKPVNPALPVLSLPQEESIFRSSLILLFNPACFSFCRYHAEWYALWPEAPAP